MIQIEWVWLLVIFNIGIYVGMLLSAMLKANGRDEEDDGKDFFDKEDKDDLQR